MIATNAQRTTRFRSTSATTIFACGQKLPLCMHKKKCLQSPSFLPLFSSLFLAVRLSLSSWKEDTYYYFLLCFSFIITYKIHFLWKDTVFSRILVCAKNFTKSNIFTAFWLSQSITKILKGDTINSSEKYTWWIKRHQEQKKAKLKSVLICDSIYHMCWCWFSMTQNYLVPSIKKIK